MKPRTLAYIALALFVIPGVLLARKTKPSRFPKYDRAVNETLDTVMWVHEQLAQDHGKITWAELNERVCREMNVRRTEPGQRQ